jgi:hypothetical protein
MRYRHSFKCRYYLDGIIIQRLYKVLHCYTTEWMATLSTVYDSVWLAGASMPHRAKNCIRSVERKLQTEAGVKITCETKENLLTRQSSLFERERRGDNQRVITNRLTYQQGTRVKNAQVVTGLQTSCYKSVHKLSTSCVRTACSQLL